MARGLTSNWRLQKNRCPLSCYIILLDYAGPEISHSRSLPAPDQRRSRLRGRALFGGLAFVATVVLWHRPKPEPLIGPDASRSICSGAGGFCDAVTGLSTTLARPIVPAADRSLLPPPGTPGAIDRGVTQANIETTICRPGYARSVRPEYEITGPIKRRLMNAEHPNESMADYELDHLIPISLGGAPLDRRDLWLQPRRGPATAGDKNVLAYVLWRLVCERRVPLARAQAAIRTDWITAYRTYATPENVAKYHFRHGEEVRD